LQNKPITIIVPYAPGGTSDVIARRIAPHVSQRMGRDVIVDNRSGGGGIIGANAVLNAPADGHTWMLQDTSFATMSVLLDTDVFKRLLPLNIVAAAPNVIVVSNNLPVNNLQALIAYAKEHPGRINFGSGGLGSASHLQGEWFKSLTGTNIVHVPYRGGGAVATALLANEVQLAFLGFPSVLPHIQGNRIKALAVTSQERVAALPAVQTTSEQGVASMTGMAWNAIFLPKNTAPELIAWLNAEINEVLETPEVRARLASLSLEPVPLPHSAVIDMVDREIALWRGVVQKNQVRLN